MEALALERSHSRAGALAAVPAEWRSLKQAQAEAVGSRATRAASASRRSQINAGSACGPAPGRDRQNLFAAIEGPGASQGS
jgi:hypothetical protein